MCQEFNEITLSASTPKAPWLGMVDGRLSDEKAAQSPVRLHRRVSSPYYAYKEGRFQAHYNTDPLGLQSRNKSIRSNLWNCRYGLTNLAPALQPHLAAEKKHPARDVGYVVDPRRQKSQIRERRRTDRKYFNSSSTEYSIAYWFLFRWIAEQLPFQLSWTTD